jgi:hypothetical protein
MRYHEVIGRGALASLWLLTLLAPATVRAEPYLMVRAGAKCSACHVNQSGGGKRTAFAHIHAKDILHDLDLLPIPSGVKAFNGEINQYVSIGADFRVRNTTVFNDPRNREGRVPQDRAFRRKVVSNDLAVREALLYAQVDLWPDILSLYIDEDLNGGANNREAFGLLRGVLPWESYVKAGRFYPTFGLRVHDDDAFIRRRSGFTFVNPDEGVEIGIQPGPFSLATSITNGSSGDKDIQFTVNGYTVIEDVPVVRNVIAGLSYARVSDRKNVLGIYGGANLWRLSYLAEVDFIDDRSVAAEPRRDQFAAYGELNLLALDWLNFRGTFDFVKVANNRDQVRWAIGAEPFINKYIQPRIQYRINNGPSRNPELNQNELWLELHLFL